LQSQQTEGPNIKVNEKVFSVFVRLTPAGEQKSNADTTTNDKVDGKAVNWAAIWAEYMYGVAAWRR
jgi:hypothetical protein